MKFASQLLSWYRKNKRDLPWRRTKDPYLIWLSEIILQQTRIEQGTPYYLKFVAAYPTVQHLAAADEQEVLKLWQGLGYYSRARNLHLTAQTIIRMHGGKFPGAYADIRNLKGIGDYTAAAIASICFELPHAVVDGNVVRFISRVFGVTESINMPETKKKIQAIATENMDRRNPGDFNQAVMEFGATVCKPANPDCACCIFRNRCFAHKNNMVEEIPVRKLKGAIRHRFLHYLVITFMNRGTEFVYLNKRTGNDIWRNLYDFPSLERELEGNEQYLPDHELFSLMNSETPCFREVSREYVHLLTHQKLHARFYRFHSDKPIELPYLLIPLKEIHKYPVPKLIDRYLLQNLLVS
jgi:A/G-specific adenine glycosylase